MPNDSLRVRTSERTQSRCETDQSEEPEDHGEPWVASTPECQAGGVIHAFILADRCIEHEAGCPGVCGQGG